MRVEITLSGPPRGKGRGRAVSTKFGARVFTDDKTRRYEAQLRFAAQQEMQGAAPITGPCAVWVHARFAIAPSWSKKKRQQAIDGWLRPCCKPDSDNILKSACDSINGVVWVDDVQAVDTRVTKVYSERPGLTIVVETIDPEGPLFTVASSAKQVAPPDPVARARGALDARTGQQVWESTYPPGVYGHADYILGRTYEDDGSGRFRGESAAQHSDLDAGAG